LPTWAEKPVLIAWTHDETKIINYDPLLSRIFVLLTQKNPDHASSGSKS